MKSRFLLVSAAMIAVLAIVSFALPRSVSFEPAAADSVSKATAATAVTTINVATTEVAAARQVAPASEVAYSLPGKGETVTTAKQDIDLQKGIRFTNESLHGRTGPPLIEKATLPDRTGAGYDKPGWIDLDATVAPYADVAYVRRN